MDSTTKAAFVAHVRKLLHLATTCTDEDRRLDAVRSLCAIAILSGDPIDPGDGGEVIDISEYLKIAA